MKLSMTRAYEGFDPEAHLLSISVWLDGVKITNVLAFDTDAGTIVTLGPPNDTSGGPPQEIVSHGKVEVKDFDTGRVLYATPDKDPNQ